MPISNPGGSKLDLVASGVVGAGGAASIDLTAIPSGYKSFQLVIGMCGEGANDTLCLRFNNDSTNQHYKGQYVDDVAWTQSFDTTSHRAGIFNNSSMGQAIINITNSPSGTANKTVSYIGTNRTSTVEHGAGCWTGTDEISRITIFLAGGDIAANSIYYLWGMKA